jgi:hypothetical protein
MSEPTNPRLRAMPGGEQDQVSRKWRFQAAYPDVDIALRLRWEAVIPPGTIPGEDREQVITRYHLSELLDELETRLPLPPEMTK